jgi:hypothetical protein
MAGVSPRQLLGVAFIGCITAGVLGAKPQAAWVDASIAADTVVQQAADGWLALTERAGLDRPYVALRQAMRDAEGTN